MTAYAITFGGFLLLGGRAADLLGRRRVFLVGVVIFTAASFACGLASSEAVLIAARAVQGLGAAIISPAALSIITTTFEEGAERNKALGIWGAMGGVGAAVGVLAGGLLTKYLGWEWIFFVNVPVGITAFLLAPRFVRESRAEREGSPDVAGRDHRHRRDRPARLRGLERPEPRLGLGLDARPDHRRRRPPDRLPRDRGAGEGPADAVLDLPGPDGRRRERLLVPARRGHLLELLRPDALRPAGPPLLGAEGRPHLPRDRRAAPSCWRASRRRS